MSLSSTSIAEMIPPPPEETILIPEIKSPVLQKSLRTGSLVWSIIGMGIVAFGIKTIFTGVTNGPDVPIIHDGITIAVSGSLIAAFFSFLHQSFSEKASEPISKVEFFPVSEKTILTK